MANTIEIIGSWPSGETEYVIGTESPSKLPLVSDSDNGDVLTVVNGAWKDAAPTGGGGGDAFMIDCTFVDDTPTINKTFSEVMTAIEAGKYPMIRITGTSTFAPIQRADEGAIEFVGYIFSPPTDFTALHFALGNDNSLTAGFSNFTLTPAE